MGGFAEIAVGDAGESGDACGDVVQFGRGDGSSAEGGAVAEAAGIEDRAEATHETLCAAIVQEADHVSFVASDFVGKRRERPLAERNALL